MSTYTAVIKDYTNNQQGELIAIIEQPRAHLGKDFLRNVAWYMWSECTAHKDRDMSAAIYKDGSFVASMGCAYLARYQRVHTSICCYSGCYTFRAFNHPAQNEEEEQ